MKTLEHVSEEQDTKLKNKEVVMSHTALSSELTEVTGNSMSLESIQDEEKRTHKKYSLVVELISSILVVVMGLVMYKVTGLYDGVNSVVGKIALGSVISICYLAVFRHAVYRFR